MMHAVVAISVLGRRGSSTFLENVQRVGKITPCFLNMGLDRTDWLEPEGSCPQCIVMSAAPNAGKAASHLGCTVDVIAPPGTARRGVLEVMRAGG